MAAIAVGVLVTPSPGQTAASGLLGLPRLLFYAIAGIALGTSATGNSFPLADESVRGRPGNWRDALRGSGIRELALGVLLALAVSVGNAIRLIRQPADPVGPIAWAVSMLVLVAATLLPAARRSGWVARWPGNSPLDLEFARWLGSRRWLLLGGLLVVAALIRFPGLGSIPIGLQADEGDRAYWALLVLRGQAPPSWFDSGWYYINMVYFHLLAATMTVFGTGLAGARTLNAFAGLGFVGAVAWIGCRSFGWRTGLLATALATGGALYVQQSRYVGEVGPTILLWAVSIAAFCEAGRRGRPWTFALAGLAGGLGLYFYPSARLWGIGATATVAALWWLERRDARGALLRGAILAAIASLIAVTPFLVHLHQHPEELATRYSETSVLDPRNQPRLPYLNPPVSTPEMLVLQAERTLGMFDRYEDGIATLPIQRPAMPVPLGALTLAGLAWATYRAWRDPRFAVLMIWFGLGMSGVFLTVETPDYQRAAGALVTLPLIAAAILVELVDRVPVALRVATERTRGAWASSPTGTARRVGGALMLLGGGILAVEAYLYVVVYPPIMAPRWEYATEEGLQVAKLGRDGPVYALEAYHFHIGSGWVHFLAQSAPIGQLGDPGALLPVGPGETFQGRAVPIPTSTQSMSFLLYDSPNQAPYVGLLQALYPGGQLQPPVDDRRAYVVSPDALARTRGVTVLKGSTDLGVVARFGALPPGATDGTVTWQGGVRFASTGTYLVRVQASGRSTVAVDGQTLATLDHGSAVVAFSAAGGLHFFQLTSEVAGPADGPHLYVRPAAVGGQFREPGPDDLYAPMKAPWGLLAHVETIDGAPDPLLGTSNWAHLDVTVAGSTVDTYLPTDAHTERVWSGQLIAPRDGVYRFGFAAEGPVSLSLDGRSASVPVVPWADWTTNQPGAAIHLTAGPHALQITLKTSPVIRWNWVPPRADGTIDASGAWTVVPPTVLRPDHPIWDVQPPTR